MDGMKQNNFARLPILTRLSSVGSLFLSSMRNFVYPPNCINCGLLLSQHDALCTSCWKDVQFIDQPYCEVTGRPFAYELGDGIVSAGAIADPPPYKRARSTVIYDGIPRHLVHQLKFNDRADLANMMAAWMIRAGRDCLNDSDCLVPIPLHRWRLIRRKYNQSAELARAISKKTNLPFLPSTFTRLRHTKPQIGLGTRERLENVKGAFDISEERVSDIMGKRVLLIDDVFTTGATVNAATKVLLKAGASNVSVLTFALVGRQ